MNTSFMWWLVCFGREEAAKEAELAERMAMKKKMLDLQSEPHRLHHTARTTAHKART